MEATNNVKRINFRPQFLHLPHPLLTVIASPANHVDRPVFSFPLQQSSVFFSSFFQSCQRQVGGVLDCTHFSFHLGPDINQQVWRTTFHHLCQLPGSDSLIRWQQYNFPILVRCTGPTELLIVDQLGHLGSISPSTQFDKPASPIKPIKEKEAARVARLHATKYLHSLK